VLRNQVDPRPGVTGGATKTSLLGMAPLRPEPVAPVVAVPVAVKPPPQLAQAAPRSRACIGVIAGVQRTQECL
jgi:pilus assembly protein CpaB